MQRFLLQQNIARFEARLSVESDARLRATVEHLLASARHDLAELDSRPSSPKGGGRLADLDSAINHLFRDQFETSPRPYLLLDPRPGLAIVDLNAAYAKATMIAPESVVGRPLFDVFPDNPGVPGADGVTNLSASLAIAAKSGRPHSMAIQRYDVRDAEGNFVERYWQPLNSAVLDRSGGLVYLLHHVEDVTAKVLSLSPPTPRRV